MVAFGWTAVAQVWAVALVVMALVFWFTTEDDPVIAAQRRRGERPQSTMMQLTPLRRARLHHREPSISL